MIAKNLKNIFAIAMLLLCNILLAANDTIQKAQRAIPENFKEAYTSKDYVYNSDPTFIESFKLWLNQLIYSFFKNFGITNKGIYYTKLGFYFLIASAAIYIIARMFFYKEGAWIFRKSKSQNNLTYQNEVEIIEMANFEELIKKATQQEDYRLAVKYGYFWVLQKFAEKEIIELSNLKTNADYQLETEDTPYQQAFKSISYYYNYIWYGEFIIDKTAYDKVEAIYKELLNNIKS